MIKHKASRTKKSKKKNEKTVVCFADTFNENVKFQLKKLTKAICLYEKDAIKMGILLKLVSSSNKHLIQPRALGSFAKKMERKLDKKRIKKVHMFTVITGEYDFGIDAFQNNLNHITNFRRQVQDWLDGYDYIATIAFDFFPNTRSGNDGILVAPHVHGIFFEKISKRHKEKISASIKREVGEKCILRPLVIEKYGRNIDAIHYAFKGPFGGKYFYKIVEEENVEEEKYVRKRTSLSPKNYFDIVQNLQAFRIDDFCFAGGSGEEILSDIKKEMKNVQRK